MAETEARADADAIQEHEYVPAATIELENVTQGTSSKNAAVPVESEKEGNATIEEPAAGKLQKSSESDKIDAAIENAIKKRIISAESDPAVVSTGKHITFLVKHSKLYTLPWTWCSTLERLESFLRDVYASDERSLLAISQHNYIITFSGEGRLMGKALHEVYDKVVSPGWYLDIEILDDSDAPPPEEPTSYDSKVKYSIDCFRKNAQGSNDYMWTVSASNPTTFEYDMDTRGDLPVIEEKKILDISITSRMRKPDTGFKGRLRRPQHDLVSGALLTVHSHYLLNVLKSIIQYATGVDDYTNGDFFFPYKDLFRHRAEIEDYKTFHKARSQHSAEYNEQCDKHIDILLQYLDSHPTIRYPEHKMIWNRPKPMTTFAGLWLLLKPCTDVYVQDNEKLNAFVIDKVSGGVSYPVEPSAALRATEYSVRVWNLHFDGKIIYRRSQWILVPYFDGERDITSLPLFPVQYQDTADASATRDSLIERGKKYFSYCKSPTFLEYSGAGLKDGWLKVSSEWSVPRKLT
ncbi:hypothetical protein DPSP01_010010 [Paraphaeosphaeria sporulosa]